MLPKRQVTAGDPKDDLIAETASRRGRPDWLQTIIAIPAAALPLLPSFSCPVCIAAYAGLLSSLGLGLILTDRVQRPLIVAFLIISVASVGWAARRYKRAGPFVLVLLGAAGIVTGRLAWSVAPALYAGVICLVAGTVWNLILKRPRRQLAESELSQEKRPGGPSN